MASFITPFRPIETGPPWGWNPGQTFVQAFNDAQALQIKREEMENERQIMEILLPYKIEKAKWDISNLKADVNLAKAVERERAANVSYKNAMAEEIRRGRGRGSNASAQWLGPGKGFSSGSTGGDASKYNIDRSGLPVVEPDFTVDGEEPSDEEPWDNANPNDFERLPDLGKPVEDMPADPVETSSNNPLRPEDPAAIFADLNTTPGELMPRQSEGWANPLAQIDEDAASVPIGAQKFDTGLADTTPPSNISEDATDRLNRIVGPVPEQTAQEPTKDEQILQDVLGRYKTLQQNRKTDIESAALLPPEERPDLRNVEKFYQEEERAIFQEADALATPLVAALSQPAQDSYLKQTTAARPVFPLTAYNRALAMDERAKANPPAENPADLYKQKESLITAYNAEGRDIYADPDGRAKLNSLDSRIKRAETASGTEFPSAWDKVTETFTNEAFLESKRKLREPEFNYLGRQVNSGEIDKLVQNEVLRRNELLSSPELRNQLRVTQDTYTVYDKNNQVDEKATNAERQRQLSTLGPNEPYEAEDGSIKTWSPRAERPTRTRGEAVRDPNNPFRGASEVTAEEPEPFEDTNTNYALRQLENQLTAYKRQRESIKSDRAATEGFKEREWDKYSTAIRDTEKQIADLRKKAGMRSARGRPTQPGPDMRSPLGALSDFVESNVLPDTHRDSAKMQGIRRTFDGAGIRGTRKPGGR